MQKICERCGKPFAAARSVDEKGLARFCSLPCWNAFQLRNGPHAPYARIRGGRRPDLGNRFFRSAWEANWARYLNWLKEQGDVQDWDYECDTFEFKGIKRGVLTYTPDFKVVNRNGTVEYHEIKGWMNKESATKLKRMAKYYPDIKVVVIERDSYSAVARQVRCIIPGWEWNAHHKM